MRPHAFARSFRFVSGLLNLPTLHTQNIFDKMPVLTGGGGVGDRGNRPLAQKVCSGVYALRLWLGQWSLPAARTRLITNVFRFHLQTMFETANHLAFEAQKKLVGR